MPAAKKTTKPKAEVKVEPTEPEAPLETPEDAVAPPVVVADPMPALETPEQPASPPDACRVQPGRVHETPDCE